MNKKIIKIVAPVAILLVGIGSFKMLEAGKPVPEKKTEEISVGKRCHCNFK